MQTAAKVGSEVATRPRPANQGGSTCKGSDYLAIFLTHRGNEWNYARTAALYVPH